MKSRLLGPLFLVLTVVAAARADVRLVLSVEGRGDVAIRLLTDRAPKTCAQIERLANAGFYNGLRFHRVEKNPRPFLVEVGDPRSRNDVQAPDLGSQGSGTKIPFEDSGVDQDAGVVGLVRSESEKNSGDSAFYILLSPARFLNGKYTAFGQVVAGMDVVARIQRGDRIASAKIVRS